MIAKKGKIQRLKEIWERVKIEERIIMMAKKQAEKINLNKKDSESLIITFKECYQATLPKNMK